MFPIFEGISEVSEFCKNQIFAIFVLLKIKGPKSGKICRQLQQLAELEIKHARYVEHFPENAD